MYEHKYHLLIGDSGDITLSIETARGEYVYVSHGHSDHAIKGKNKRGMITSPETAHLISVLAPLVKLPGISLIPSGHILGSTQLVADTVDGRLVYTGDLRLSDGILFKGAEVVETDILIIESTYGDPSISFPDVWSVYSDIQKWVKQNERYNILIGAYSLGKAQEVIRVLNEMDITPVVDKKTDFYCSVYERFNIKLDRVVVGSEEAREVMRGPFVVVAPPKIVNKSTAVKMRYKFGRPTLTALTTGLGHYFKFKVHKVFPLSDHADFNQLIEYVEMSNPKVIYTHHGLSRRFALELQKRGFNAQVYSSLKSSQRLLSV